MDYQSYLSHNVAVNLKRIRTSKGMSLDVLSEQTGVSKIHMVGYFLVDDYPKRIIDFIHAFPLLPPYNGYKYQTIPDACPSNQTYQSR